MRAMVLRRYGGPEVLEEAELADPEPGEDEVLVRLTASAIEPIDLGVRRGDVLPDEPDRFPMVLGWDGVGEIVGAGDRADPDASDDLPIGARVLCMSAQPASGVGLHAELAALPRDRVVDGGRYATVVPAFWKPGGPFAPERGIEPVVVENAASAAKLRALASLALEGTIRPRIEREWPLARLADAHAALERTGLRGRHVLVH